MFSRDPDRSSDEKRNGQSDVDTVVHANGAVERRDIRVDVEREAIHVKWRGFVDELVGGGHHRPVAQLLAVERREAERLNGQPERDVARAGSQRSLDEERPEVLGQALDGAELGVEPVHERAG